MRTRLSTQLLFSNVANPKNSELDYRLHHAKCVVYGARTDKRVIVDDFILVRFSENHSKAHDKTGGNHYLGLDIVAASCMVGQQFLRVIRNAQIPCDVFITARGDKRVRVGITAIAANHKLSDISRMLNQINELTPLPPKLFPPFTTTYRQKNLLKRMNYWGCRLIMMCNLSRFLSE